MATENQRRELRVSKCQEAKPEHSRTRTAQQQEANCHAMTSHAARRTPINGCHRRKCARADWTKPARKAKATRRNVTQSENKLQEPDNCDTEAVGRCQLLVVRMTQLLASADARVAVLSDARISLKPRSSRAHERAPRRPGNARAQLAEVDATSAKTCSDTAAARGELLAFVRGSGQASLRWRRGARGLAVGAGINR